MIPKDIRSELGIDEGTGFWMHSITNEGILLKKVNAPDLNQEVMIEEIKEKAEKLGLKKENLRKTLKDYQKDMDGNLEVI